MYVGAEVIKEVFELVSSIRKAFVSSISAKHRPLRVKMDLFFGQIASLNPLGQQIASSLRNGVIYFFDLLTYLRFRKPGLKKYQLLFVHPAEVEWGFKTAPPHHFGVVSKRVWHYARVPVLDALDGVPRFCFNRLSVEGTWELSGELERVVEERARKGKNQNSEDSDFQTFWHKRYSSLDGIIEELKQTNRLRPRAELLSKNFREKGGIGVMVDQGGHLVLCDGHHRFGISLALDVQSIPVALFSVHPDFAKNQKWEGFFESHRHEPSVSNSNP